MLCSRRLSLNLNTTLSFRQERHNLSPPSTSDLLGVSSNKTTSSNDERRGVRRATTPSGDIQTCNSS